MLNEAIKQVREDVVKGMGIKEAVADAAADFDLNPALVQRKFFDKYGSVEKVLGCAEVQERLEAEKPAKLKEKLELLGRMYGRCTDDRMFGMELNVKGRKSLLVRAIAHNAVLVMDVETLAPVEWAGPEAVDVANRAAVRMMQAA
jgi:hypothetical protein